MYWGIVNNKVVGRINLRPKLNKKLRIEGGNIGTAVRPGEQNKGYAKEMVVQVLKKAKKLGLKKVLRTCDEDNDASKKVIEATGGIFQKKIKYDGVLICQYVVKL
jgi:predicted acetyltransferase